MLGWTIPQLVEWLEYDSTGQHPESYHEVRIDDKHEWRYNIQEVHYDHQRVVCMAKEGWMRFDIKCPTLNDRMMPQFVLSNKDDCPAHPGQRDCADCPAFQGALSETDTFFSSGTYDGFCKPSVLDVWVAVYALDQTIGYACDGDTITIDPKEALLFESKEAAQQACPKADAYSIENKTAFLNSGKTWGD